jgi:hypothetical protein
MAALASKSQEFPKTKSAQSRGWNFPRYGRHGRIIPQQEGLRQRKSISQENVV